ncbi:MAG: 4-hydroxythreonine-4-phosphate dehydrogenase PdxA [Lentisphaeria bacterium]|nr:4-hydroxythreonine-4-phosphate dehydrogenase PdxA [Lentisphaeria bacterium]
MVKIALTMGDPAGIGPELCVRTAALPEFSGVKFIIYGGKAVIEEAAKRFSGRTMPEVCDTGSPEELIFGKNSAGCGKAAYDALTAATCDAIDGKVDAIVTAPMNKYSVNLTGIPFSGHTERIAELCNTPVFAMMQSSGKFRVAFVTTHIGICDVPSKITFERIINVGKMLNDVAKAEGVDSPVLACAALNPHAGENGCMGKEDEEIVKPAVAALNAMGIKVEGPIPPDVVFVEKIRSKYDGIISMYHDQGHIPFKMLAFDSGVNSTLGLPIIRTSPDHGTAFDIAWQGKADMGSFLAACRTAILRAERKSPVHGQS